MFFVHCGSEGELNKYDNIEQALGYIEYHVNELEYNVSDFKVFQGNELELIIIRKGVELGVKQ